MNFKTYTLLVNLLFFSHKYNNLIRYFLKLVNYTIVMFKILTFLKYNLYLNLIVFKPKTIKLKDSK